MLVKSRINVDFRDTLVEGLNGTRLSVETLEKSELISDFYPRKTVKIFSR